MRHRTRAKATHDLTAERREQTGTDGDGEPIFGHTEILVDEPVRYRAGGTAYVRESSGERVSRNPVVMGRVGLQDELQEGDDVTLTPRSSTDQTLSGRFEIVAVDGQHGRRGSSYARIELEDTD